MSRLPGSPYDVLVIGGGITGACIAWDASLRGLHVALVEKGDFGAATSANSLKTVHGGLRYLQDASLRQVRKMVRERQAFLRIAPHLVRPLPFVMPTYRRNLRHNKFVLGAALKLNDLLSIDRNREMDPARVLPGGRILSRERCLELMPGLDAPGVTGAILWHDAQIQNTERLVLAFILSAAKQGAHVANYIEVTGLLQQGQRVVGVTAEDHVSSQSLEIEAGVVINATGAWADEVIGNLNGSSHRLHFETSAAINLVTRQIISGPAVALPSTSLSSEVEEPPQQQSQMLIVAPWRGTSIVGTLHFPYMDHPNNGFTTGERVERFLAQINRAYPPADLRRRDVYQVHFGFLPAKLGSASSGTVTLLRHEQLVDHSADGVQGLLTAVGVKYTTARHLAEKTVDLAFRKLDRPVPPCRTHFQPLRGGKSENWQQFREQAIASVTGRGFSAPVAAHLVDNYGTAFTEITAYMKEDQCWGETVGPDSNVTRAEIIHAIRHEMAFKLDDVIRRRTELGSAGPPPVQMAEHCATLMARELGWDRQRTAQEIAELYETYSQVTL